MRAERRDENETKLVQLAEQLGCTWFDEGPWDGWIWIPRMAKFSVVEIKIPEREGLAHEFTPKQRRMLRMFEQRGIPLVTWRTADDVLASCGARRAA